MDCKIGDIIVIKNYLSHGHRLSRHSFVVLDTKNGQIEGMAYDLVCNVMSSFHDKKHRNKKLSYSGNFEYSPSDQVVGHGNNKRGFIKANQLYYFDSSKIEYRVIGSVLPGVLEALLLFAQSLKSVEHITDNLHMQDENYE